MLEKYYKAKISYKKKLIDKLQGRTHQKIDNDIT